MKRLLWICFGLIWINAFAQTPQAIEAELLKAFTKIEDLEAHGKYANLEQANNIFQAKLKKYTAKYPFTFDQKFSSIKHLVIKFSDDKNLKLIPGMMGLVEQ